MNTAFSVTAKSTAPFPLCHCQCVLLPHVKTYISQVETRITTWYIFSEQKRKSTRKYVIVRIVEIDCWNASQSDSTNGGVFISNNRVYYFISHSLCANAFTLSVIVSNPPWRQNPTALTKLQETTKYVYTLRFYEIRDVDRYK